MSSISKLTPAAIATTAEFTAAFANINFDFSLYKIEAPKEFDGVGSSLSTRRRDEAENGMPHITARKLGALFGALIPSTPNVSRAYGQRASEISRASSISPQTRSRYGVFSSQVGSDATSIWAAATSGSAAIAIHLLACLLAKMWDGPEATAIWVEIVQRRKELIRAELDATDIVQMATLAAAQQDITQAQLAEWDASARSWLRTADRVKYTQQKQLMLIVDNVKGCVNKMSDTYESVLTAWKHSLTQMEGLIQGISQQAMSGDILLASSAWHLFPDMQVVDPCTTLVVQNDPIFKSSGVLTVGLEKPNLDQNGIHWSLPLARLRHYGAPVVSSCAINSSERSRLSLTEFLQAFLGCFLQGWGDAASDTLRAIKWLSHIHQSIEDTASIGLPEAKAISNPGAEFSWLNLLFVAARYHLNCEGNEKQIAKKLLLLGRRHGKDFLGLPREPMFGFLSSKVPNGGMLRSNVFDKRFQERPDVTLRRGCFVEQILSEDDQISFLRKVARDICQELQLESHQLFIRYKHTCPGSSNVNYEYATAVPWKRGSAKRKFDESEHENQVHQRWLYAGSTALRKGRISNARYIERLKAKFIIQRRGTVPARFARFLNIQPSGGDTHLDDGEDVDSDACHSVRHDFERRVEIYTALGEEVIEREGQYIEDFAADEIGIFWDRMGEVHSDSSNKPWFEYLYGDIHSAAIFVMEGKAVLIDLIRPVRQDSQEMYSLFEAGKMEPNAVVRRLAWHFQTADAGADPHLKSAKAVSTAAMIYKNFPDATIDIRVIQCKLWQAQWVNAAASSESQYKSHLFTNGGTPHGATPQSLTPYSLNRACAFACVTMFESGHYDPNPEELSNVMAMSTGDSLFVGGALLCDPSPISRSGMIKRISGNIGRPGIAFLVPPLAPLMKQVSISEWPMAGSEDFEGFMKDCFKGISLHLSFTGASTPVNVGFSGAQNTDVYMLETLVSVHDSGKWIADLNVLDTFRSSNLHFIPLCADQHHDSRAVHRSYRPSSLENLLQLVDKPDEHVCLVQTQGNWEARLAASSISVAKEYPTIIAPEKWCWDCFGNTMRHFSSTVGPVIFIM